MRIKVHGGTRNTTALCYTCSKAHVRKGTAHGQEVVICNASYELPQRITYPIVECNDYKDTNLPSLSEMNRIAWFITADKRTGKVGFVSAEKADESVRDAVYNNDPFTE